MDPLAGSSWSEPGMVAGFARSNPNATLVQFADAELRRVGRGRLADIGCGAGRNAIPLADIGWDVVGTDLSWPMVQAAHARTRAAATTGRTQFLLAPMRALPMVDNSVDLVIAHGIWNLARSAEEFRRGVKEAARIARPGAGLFVFTFSRHTLSPDARPVAGEPFVFTGFSGDPQCFLTEEQLMEELQAGGFVPDPAVPLREHNASDPRAPFRPAGPVIYEGTFRRP
ncbi:MAG: class I SAM-dependent methyltransferase [Acidobacteriota bacterium]